MSLPTSSTDPFGRSTSGSTSFRMLTYDIVKEAFTYCGIALDTEGEQLSNGYLSEGKRSLNTMIATWQAQGIHLWTYQECYLFLEADVSSYVLEQVKCTNRYTEALTTTDALTSGNTVELSTTSELDIGWQIGLMNSSKNIVWREVADVTDPVVEITTTWPEDIDTGSKVYYYENQIRPVERILDVRRFNLFSGNNETPVALESHQHYFRLPDKSSRGVVSEVTYDRTLPEGVMYVWQTPQNSADQLRVTYERKIEDFINNDDCPDFPKYWMEALTFGLADRLSAKYNVSVTRKADIQRLASEALEQALSFDNANYNVDVTISGYSR